MSHALHIALNVFLSLFALGFVGWLLWLALKQSDSPVKLILKWVLTIALAWFNASTILDGSDIGYAMISTLGLGVLIIVFWRESMLDAIGGFFGSLYDGGSEPPELKPSYSLAQAKRKTNHPLEAIMAIREQLAKFPTDFEGVMLLANIQAEDLNDLPGAENTLNHFCALPGAPDRQVVAALTQLADWHLKKSADVDAARVALQKIVARFPDTEIALRAEQRLAHLGETEKIILAQYDRQAVALPAGVDNVGLLASTDFLRPKEIEPGKLAAVHVKHLEQHPHDTEVRVKLATIYARDFKRLDVAKVELCQWINEPKHKPKQVAAWLNLLANFQVELGADVATVTDTLGRIVEQFPDSPMAEIAARRLARIHQELQGKKETPGVKLGVYEQNVGLRTGLPRQL